MVIDVKRSEEDVISMCGRGGVCVAMGSGLQLAAVEDLLRQKSPPRRIYKALRCGIE